MMETRDPQSVGLGGDGDEIEAITDVERAFGVKLDYGNAGQWITAGDVFDALLVAIPASERAQTDLWERFAKALCGITGVDPRSIEPASPLLSQCRFWGRVADASAVVWIALALGLAGAVGIAFFSS
jgi:pyruvate carboxylase